MIRICILFCPFSFSLNYFSRKMYQGQEHTVHRTEKEIQIAHKHMTGCSISFIIRKMQIRSTQRDHFLPIRLAKTQKSDNTLCWQGCWEKGTPEPCWWKWKLVQTYRWQLDLSIKVTNAYTLCCNSSNFWKFILQIFLLKNKIIMPGVMFRTEVF